MNNENKIKVWDGLVRIFHWTLAASFLIAYITQEEENIWHVYSGYTVLGLITFRVLWGVIGTKYARFSEFIYSPKMVLQYIKGLINNNPKRYIGHNPAGGWMIVALLLSLFVVTISGLKVYAIEEGRGPLAGITTDLSVISHANADSGEDEKEEEFWEEIHETSANIVLFLILMHIAGVVASSRLHNENLIKSMITGKKKTST